MPESFSIPFVGDITGGTGDFLSSASQMASTFTSADPNDVIGLIVIGLALLNAGLGIYGMMLEKQKGRERR